MEVQDLQYDPRTKQMIKDTIYNHLYEPVHAQFKTRLDTLIIRNAILGGYSHKSFTYKGELYSCDTTPSPLRRNRLVPQLKDQMDAYLQELEELNQKELPYVLGFITQVLNASNSLEDYKRLLPPAIHRPIDAFIHSCPCQTKQLTDEKVAELAQQYVVPINMIKARMVTNLIT